MDDVITTSDIVLVDIVLVFLSTVVDKPVVVHKP